MDNNPRSESVTPEHYERVLLHWADQTLVNAMLLKANDTNKLTDNPEYQAMIGVEARSISRRFMAAAKQEGGILAPFQQIAPRFIRKIFDWCEAHRKA